MVDQELSRPSQKHPASHSKKPSSPSSPRFTFVSCSLKSLQFLYILLVQEKDIMLLPRDDRYDVPWWERGNFSAIPPPPGLTSNYVNPPSKAIWGTVTTSVCLTVATLLVAMRIYTKLKVLKNPGWDDCKRHTNESRQLPG